MATDESNPLLISAPPGIVPPPKREVAPKPPEKVDEPETFITLPPGIADSATLRVASPRVVPPVPSVADDIVFFPVTPGVPAHAPSVPEPLAEETRIAAPRHVSVVTWRLLLPTGESEDVGAGLIIGRDPVSSPAWPDARVLAVVDPAKSLSKTHAFLETDGDQLWVHDLDSTNGVFVVASNADVVQVQPGTRSPVPQESEIEFGEYIVRVQRG